MIGHPGDVGLDSADVIVSSLPINERDSVHKCCIKLTLIHFRYIAVGLNS